MYDAQIIRDRVSIMVKKMGTTQKAVLLGCGITENALTKMGEKNGIASFSLAKIADALSCSVDYLLGRTDDPELRPASVPNAAPVPKNAISKMALTPFEKLLIQEYRALDPSGRKAVDGLLSVEYDRCIAAMDEGQPTITETLPKSSKSAKPKKSRSVIAARRDSGNDTPHALPDDAVLAEAVPYED